MSGYQVTLDVFEGPLDVLLRLIEGEELDISLVSLALVTDQYLAYTARLTELSASSLADFVMIA
ncbi:MAG: segregation/condensation protein A, partial [Chloroflexi bacterium]|nr:segregation/condensation protein A [Chloroflexota bacterium]